MSVGARRCEGQRERCKSELERRERCRGWSLNPNAIGMRGVGSGNRGLRGRIRAETCSITAERRGCVSDSSSWSRAKTREGAHAHGPEWFKTVAFRVIMRGRSTLHSAARPGRRRSDRGASPLPQAVPSRIASLGCIPADRPGVRRRISDGVFAVAGKTYP